MNGNNDKIISEAEDLLKTVEYKDGKPVILSRYGFHIIDVDGKKYLVASTPEELAIQRSIHYGKPLESMKKEITDTQFPNCVGEGPWDCAPNRKSGCKGCRAKYIGNGYYDCICNRT